jgi:hypothetical protein
VSCGWPSPPAAGILAWRSEPHEEEQSSSKARKATRIASEEAGMARAMRISWIVALGLIALFLLEVALNGEPFYSMVAASRAPYGLPCNIGYEDACTVQVFFSLIIILLLPAALIILSLLLIGIVEAARHRCWLWLASLAAPLPLSVALIPAYATYLWRLGIDDNIAGDFIVACAAAAPILSLVYTFLSRRRQASTKTSPPSAEPLGDSPA